jgi:FkbM family methyltransferase
MLKRLLFVLLCLSIVLLTSFACYRQGYYSAKEEPQTLTTQAVPNFRFTSTLPNGLTYFGHSENIIDQVVLQRGYYEPEVVKLMQQYTKFLRQHNKDQNTPDKEIVFLDVGANVGNHTLGMATEVDRVIAIEAFPWALNRLYTHIKENNLSNVEVIEAGLSNKQEKKKILASFPEVPLKRNNFESNVLRTHTNSSLRSKKRRKKRVKKNFSDSTSAISIVRGDDALGDTQIDIVKVSDNSFEQFALEGLKMSLNKHRPLVILKINQSKNSAFASKDDLVEVLPQKYELYFINYKLKNLCLARLEGYWSRASTVVAIPEEFKKFPPASESDSCLHFWDHFSSQFFTN